jgi:hypothetical protein
MRVLCNPRCFGWTLAVIVLGGVSPRAWAQASALPSAQIGQGTQSKSEPNKGRELLNEMIAALGGEAWLSRQYWILYGRLATFYKGQPHEGAPQFEEYCRTNPFGERVVIISHYGALIATNHSDVAQVWTNDEGYEITYKGTKQLPAKEVDDYQRRHKHSLDVAVKDWLKQPGVLVTYEGTNMVERRLAEQVSILSASNDAVTLELDQSTHLPLRLSFQWRDPVYKDWNMDVQEFADYHDVQGIMTPYSITALHNGDVTEERFLTKVVYSAKLPADLFDPNRPLEKKAR